MGQNRTSPLRATTALWEERETFYLSVAVKRNDRQRDDDSQELLFQWPPRVWLRPAESGWLILMSRVGVRGIGWVLSSTWLRLLLSVLLLSEFAHLGMLRAGVLLGFWSNFRLCLKPNTADLYYHVVSPGCCQTFQRPLFLFHFLPGAAVNAFYPTLRSEQPLGKVG